MEYRNYQRKIIALDTKTKLWAVFTDTQWQEVSEAVRAHYIWRELDTGATTRQLSETLRLVGQINQEHTFRQTRNLGDLPCPS